MKGLIDIISEGRGRLFRRTDGTYLIYVPVDLAKDSMFPFKASSTLLHVSFPLDGKKQLDIRPWTQQDEAKRTHQQIEDIEK